MTGKKSIHIFSVTTIILGNLVPLLGVFMYGWNADVLLLVYWIETIIIALFSLVKVGMVKTPVDTVRAAGSGKKYRDGVSLRDIKINVVVVTLFFFTLMVITHWKVIGSLVGRVDIVSASAIVSIIGILMSHSISFVIKYLSKQEYVTAIPNDLVQYAMLRLLCIHVVSLFLGIISAGGASTAAIGGLVIVKIAVDLAIYAYEYRERKATLSL